MQRFTWIKKSGNKSKIPMGSCVNFLRASLKRSKYRNGFPQCPLAGTIISQVMSTRVICIFIIRPPPQGLFYFSRLELDVTSGGVQDRYCKLRPLAMIHTASQDLLKFHYNINMICLNIKSIYNKFNKLSIVVIIKL